MRATSYFKDGAKRQRPAARIAMEPGLMYAVWMEVENSG